MGVTAEFTGGCTDATIATPDVLTAAATTTVLPPTMGGGIGRWSSILCVVIGSEGFADAPLPTATRGGAALKVRREAW
jgi:hypothetical protein